LTKPRAFSFASNEAVELPYMHDAALYQEATIVDAMESVPVEGGEMRTVYLGNLHPDTTVEELCNVVRGGALERIKLLSDRGIAFVTFLYCANAQEFVSRTTRDGLTVRHRKLKVGWGRSCSSLPLALQSAVSMGASRNVYIGGVTKQPDSLDEEEETKILDRLRADFREYGEIELVNRPAGMDCAFVNFYRIQSAIKALEGIKKKPGYEGLRINFGKDRCGNSPRVTKPAVEESYLPAVDLFGLGGWAAKEATYANPLLFSRERLSMRERGLSLPPPPGVGVVPERNDRLAAFWQVRRTSSLAPHHPW